MESLPLDLLDFHGAGPFILDVDINTIATRDTPTPSPPPSLHTPVSTAQPSILIPNAGVVDFSLPDFCSYVDESPSLSQGTILSVEGYRQRSGVVIHRFVVLELSFEGQGIRWLRLDRRREQGVSVMKFVKGAGETEANDKASLSGTKLKLIGKATLENKRPTQSTNRPSMSNLNRLLRIITEELEKYHIWPDNCWFFCSLIQQHIAAAKDGWYGNVKHLEIGNTIRHNVLARYWGHSSPTLGPVSRLSAEGTPWLADAAAHADVRPSHAQEETNQRPNPVTQHTRSYSSPSSVALPLNRFPSPRRNRTIGGVAPSSFILQQDGPRDVYPLGVNTPRSHTLPSPATPRNNEGASGSGYHGEVRVPSASSSQSSRPEAARGALTVSIPPSVLQPYPSPLSHSPTNASAISHHSSAIAEKSIAPSKSPALILHPFPSFLSAYPSPVSPSPSEDFVTGQSILQTLEAMQKLKYLSGKIQELMSSAQTAVEDVYHFRSASRSTALHIVDPADSETRHLDLRKRLYERLADLLGKLAATPSVSKQALELITRARYVLRTAYKDDELPEKVAKLYLDEGCIFFSAQRYQEAIKPLENGIQIYSQLDFVKNGSIVAHLIDCHIHLSKSYRASKNSLVAQEHANEAVALAEGARALLEPTSEIPEWTKCAWPRALIQAAEMAYAAKDGATARAHGNRALKIARDVFRSSHFLSVEGAEAFADALKICDKSMQELSAGSLRPEMNHGRVVLELAVVCSAEEWYALPKEYHKCKWHNYVGQKLPNTTNTWGRNFRRLAGGVL